jgi:hypothetical protein
MSTKTCGRCEIAKPLAAFSPCTKGSHGRHSHCKACRSAAQGLRNRLKAKRRNASPRAVIWPRAGAERVIDAGFGAWGATPDAGFGLRRVG